MCQQHHLPLTDGASLAEATAEAARSLWSLFISKPVRGRIPVGIVGDDSQVLHRNMGQYARQL
jgi:hypothetical protein